MRWLLALTLLAGPAWADSVVSTRIIRAGAVIQPGDLGVASRTAAGAFDRIEDLVGLEARRMIYPGRPILYDHVGSPALVDRNQIVQLSFAVQGLAITTEGRSLARAGAGEEVRVLNLSSRITVTGIVQPDGSVRVGF